jgi:maltooligosyltrehalose trehalohydrolase
VAHVIATLDVEGYYQDYAGDSVERLARALAEGFIYQGEPSSYRDGAKRGAPSAHLPSLAFINFLQNHDQIGNRAFGERLTDLAPPKAVDTLLAILLLAPSVPLLFMGEEWGETRPFAFFCDFHGQLADAVREGRRNEFRRWPKFSDQKHRALIPDPNARSTFEASRLYCGKPGLQDHAARAAHMRRLIDVRRREITPRLENIRGGCADRWISGTAFAVSWTLGDGAVLVLEANVGNDPCQSPSSEEAGAGRVIFATAGTPDDGPLPGWSCRFRVREGAGT